MSDISRNRVLLCEGYDPALAPEVVYVRQGDKVCFLLGDKSVCESASFDDTVIVESIDDLDTVDRLDEATGKTTKHVKDGVWMVEGPFQRSDVKNANGRTYPRVIWEKSVGSKDSAVQKTVREGGMVGHLEHPQDGRTDGNKGALVTRDLTLRPDGVVWGEAELLDTPAGLILQEYTRKGVRWGVSSRGNGSVDDTGRVDENNYTLTTFDGVMSPSTPGAYPTPMSSHKTENKKVGVSEDADTEPSTSLTEEAANVQAEVTALCETDFVGMSTKDRLTLSSELLQALSRVDSLRGGTLPSESAAALQDWLTKRLKGVNEALVAEVDLDAALEDVDAEDEEQAESAFRQAVSTLKARLDDAVSETQRLQDRLTVTQKAKAAVEAAAAKQIATAHADRDVVVAEAEAQLKEMRTKLEATEAALRQKDAELQVASALVSDTSAVEVRDPVDEAVTAALEANPELSQFEDVLRNAPSVERVAALVESLGAVVAPRTPVSAARRTLPVGRLVESEASAGSRTAGVSTSRGARMAGAALNKLHERAQG